MHVAATGEARLGMAQLIRADLYRYKGKRGLREGIHMYLWNPGFRFTFWFRVAAHLRSQRSLRLLYWGAEFQRRRYEIKYGISISNDTPIGPGLYIAHIGGIVVNSEGGIGRNFTISHGVMIGKMPRGPLTGCPVIGDNVFICAGAQVLGRITLGSDVVVGPNAVVVKGVESGAVVAGVPAHVVSRKGSAGYVAWAYDDRTTQCERPPTYVAYTRYVSAANAVVVGVPARAISMNGSAGVRELDRL
jgi:serine O-acetyltransferase